MKSVMISIRPEWCVKIANGQKTIEVRKTRPNLIPPFKCYIYCTNSPPYMVLGDKFRGNWETEYTTTYGYSRKETNKIWGIMNGKVIGEFVCDHIFCYPWNEYDPPFQDNGAYDLLPRDFSESCLTYSDFENYGFDGTDYHTLYGWHISALKIYGIYDDLLEITQFIKPCQKSDVCESCAMYSEFKDRCNNSALQIRRPPQSWCYVEEAIAHG